MHTEINDKEIKNSLSSKMLSSSSRFTNPTLKFSWFDSPLGPILIIADDELLFLLEFVGRAGLKKEIDNFIRKIKRPIISGRSKVTISIENEIELYFKGILKDFKTPFYTIGTDFQKTVWKELLNIPYGETITYSTLANNLNRPTAYRASANANGRNQMAIIIPCHRVIASSGQIGGYSGGIDIKKWLLNHEKQYR